MKIENPIYKKPLVWLLIIILLQIIMFTIYGTYKAGYHVDEEWSYGFANSTNGAHFYSGKINDIENEKYNHWMAGLDFFKYVTVQPGEGFSYATVYQNQVQDISPPLYTFLLHTVCSFFPEYFNKWLGIGLNMMLFLLCQIIFFLLARDALRSNYLALLVCILWGFGMGAVNATLFVRMYVLFTVLVLMTTWLHIKFLQQKVIVYRQLFYIMLITFLGGLTHNYFFVYAFVISSLTCIYLLFKGCRRLLLTYAGGMIAAVAMVCLYFPATITHIFITPQGNSSLNSLVSGELQADRLAQLLAAINNEIMGLPTVISEFIASVEARLVDTISKALYVFVLIFLVGCIVFLYKRKQENIQKVWSDLLLKIQSTFHIINKNTINTGIIINKQIIERNLVMLSVILCTCSYIGLIAVIAPNMVIFTDRYIFCVFPFISLMILAGINIVLKITRLNERLIRLLLPLIILLFCIGSQIFSPQQYLYKNTENRTRFNETVKDADCIYVTPVDYYIYSMCDAFMHSNRIFPSRPSDVAKIVQAVSEMNPEKRNLLIVYDSSGLFEFIQYYNGLLDATKILKSINEDTEYQAVFLYKALHSVDYYNVYEIKPDSGSNS